MRLLKYSAALILISRVVAAQAPSEMDRALLTETNLARTNPAAYAAHLEALLPLFDGDVIRRPGSNIGLRTDEGPTAVREAINFLRQQQPLPPMTWADGMWRAARDHVLDQGPSGATGHAGRDGSDMSQRISRYGSWLTTAAENIDYGSESARDVLISLIVDDGVPSRGHRANIFHTALRVMGGACGPHARYREMCVIDYAGGFQPTVRAKPAKQP